MLNANCTMLFDEKKSLNNWQIVNDGVMGGLSQGRLSVANDNLVFEGDLSLENNGGFSWAQHRIDQNIVPSGRRIKLKFKTHGHAYQLTIKSAADRRFHFESDPFVSLDEWSEITIDMSDMQKTWRGRSFEEYLSEEDIIQEIGFIVKDGKSGAFRLEVACITFE